MKSIRVAAILVIALGFGILADLLIREVPTGVGMFLWVSGIAGSVWFVQRLAGVELVREWKWLGGAAVVMAGAFLWRRSEPLLMLAFMAAAGAYLLMTLRGARPSLAECGLLEYGHAGIVTMTHAAIGLPMLLFSDSRRKEPAVRTRRWPIAEVARGLAIAIPIIIVLGSLLVGADDVFHQMVFSFLDIDLAALVSHLFFIGFVTWVVAGFLRGIFVAQPSSFPYAQAKPLSLGITEVTIVLGSSIVLFALFLVVQFRYLFGGADLVLVTPSLTYAEYARRGFFELTTVVALVLPILLVLDWLLRKENAGQVRLFRILAMVQVVLLFFVIASAVQRMSLYQQEYGLTQLRIYTMAFMGWLALLLAWYVATVLAGHRERFAFGAVATGFLTFVIVLAINPDAMIVRTNIARAAEGKPVDVQYLSRLSNDAVPDILERMQLIDPKSRATLAQKLLKREDRLASEDWRSWNWSSSAALRALRERDAELRLAVLQ
jgi:hypothetical protein